MSRKGTFGRKKRINIVPILTLILVLVIIVVLGVKILSPNYTIPQIEELKSVDIFKTEGTISTISSVDTKVYSNDGIKYTNKHENILRLNSFNSSIPEDTEKIQTVKSLIEKLGNLEEIGKVKELVSKPDGYYWINVSLTTEEKMLVFNSEKEYNFDLYYDIEEKNIYIKNKYYDEFSTKNNKVKLLGFKVNDEYKNLIDKLAVKTK
jgi:biopolymer transport protein ExbD